MKIFVVALVLAGVFGAQALVITKEQQQIYYKIHAECQEAHKIPEEMFENTKKGIYPDDPTFKAHLLCMSKKSGFQNEAGEYQKPVINEKFLQFYKDAIEKLVEKCAQPAKTPEEAAYNFSKCQYENRPDKYEYE